MRELLLTVENAGLGLDLPVRVAGCRRIQRLWHKLIHFSDAKMNFTHHHHRRHTFTDSFIHSFIYLFIHYLLIDMLIFGTIGEMKFARKVGNRRFIATRRQWRY